MIHQSMIAIAAFAVSLAPTTDPDVSPSDLSGEVVIRGQESTYPTQTAPGGGGGTPVSAPPPPTSCRWAGQVRYCDGAIGVYLPDDPNVAAQIRTAVESVGLPALALRIQPGGETLVNVATIFHTDAPVFQHSTVLLGQAVDITATPAQFTWHHGDGTSQTTATPGAPYPSTEVTHRYVRVADGLTPRVDVAYRVTYRVNGGAPVELDQLITASGPAASLDVAEAAPVVVAP